MSMKMGNSRRAVPPNIHLKTANEGQFLKALLEYAAGRRGLEPYPSQFGLSDRPDRVEDIRGYADGLARAMRTRSRIRRVR